MVGALGRVAPKLDLRLYWEIAARSLRRQATYRTANLAGLVTNVCFGYLRSVVFFAVYQGRTNLAGYDLSQVVTYAWVTQALMMVVSMWGWWEVEETIRSGDVATDLAKPFSYLGYWLARDYGRAIYFLVYRCVPLLVAGQLMFGLRWPSSPATWLAVVMSVGFAVTISFAWRFVINLSAFWTTDARGLGNMLATVVTLLAGLILPLPYFPDNVRSILMALPFAGILQIPADIFLERLSPLDVVTALAQQAVWALAFLLAARLILAAAVRRVVIQGG
jgi:ABC-2 type transport system permease protein